MRIQKYLSKAGVCSRRHAEKDILKGLVKVNGRVVTELGTKIDPEIDTVEYKNKKIDPKGKLIYIALNKPVGYVASCHDKYSKTILELINIKERVYPIGRLDKDSSGLLLLTNDGTSHNRFLHPSFGHEKEYDVRVAEPISDTDLRQMEKGIFIDSYKTKAAKTKRLETNRFLITLREGRNRQIRRMVKTLKNSVTNLERIKFVNVKLDGLKTGAWRYLSEKEQKLLLSI